MFFFSFFLAGQKQPENQSHSRLQGERAISMDRKEIMRHERSRVAASRSSSGSSKKLQQAVALLLLFFLYLLLYFLFVVPPDKTMQVPQAAAAAAARPGSKYCSGSHKSAIKNAYTHVPHTHTRLHMQLVVNWSSQERQSRKPLLC